MRQENELIYRRWIEEVWNNGRENIIEELFDKNGVADYQHRIGNEPIRGVNSFKEFYRNLRTFFTDIEIKIEQITSNENKVIAACTFTAQRRRLGKNILLTPEPVKVLGLWQVIIENGKIVHIWNNVEAFGTNELME